MRHPFLPYTARGAIVGLFDHIRTWFIPVAPDEDRCFMGSLVDDWVWCPRWALDGSPFCRMHNRKYAYALPIVRGGK